VVAIAGRTHAGLAGQGVWEHFKEGVVRRLPMVVIFVASCAIGSCAPSDERQAPGVLTSAVKHNWLGAGPEQDVCPSTRVSVVEGGARFLATPVVLCRIAAVAWGAVKQDPGMLETARRDTAGLPPAARILFIRWMFKDARGRDSLTAYWNVGFGTTELRHGVLSVYVDSLTGGTRLFRNRESETEWRALR
jgi:hypothetical protein